MALIKCKECEAEISDKASACPKCGAPARAAAESPGAAATQQTARRHKGLQLVGFLMIATGVVFLTSGGNSTLAWGAPLILLGLVLYIAGRLNAWWRHG